MTEMLSRAAIYCRISSDPRDTGLFDGPDEPFQLQRGAVQPIGMPGHHDVDRTRLHVSQQLFVALTALP